MNPPSGDGFNKARGPRGGDIGRFDGVFDSVVGSTMRPGTRGTKKLVRDWDDRLITVRYRYAGTPPTRFTTVELVVAAAPWKVSPRRNVHVAVKSWESDLREKIRAAGGRWVPKATRWRMRYDRAIALGIEANRISFLGPHTPKMSTDLETEISLPAQTSGRTAGKRH